VNIKDFEAALQSSGNRLVVLTCTTTIIMGIMNDIMKIMNNN